MSNGPLIDAPPRGGPARYGLLDSVEVSGFTDPHERLGARFLSEPCHGVQEYDPVICPPEPAVKEMLVGFGPEVEAVSFAFVGSFGCSRVGMTQEGIEARAQKILADGLGPAVEAKWYDYLAAEPVILAAEPVSPACALSLAVEALGGVGAGTGVIYAPGAVATQWNTLQALTVEDGRLRELLGSLVVATRAPASTPTGEGAPDGGVRWVFASDGLPVIRLGEVAVMAERDSVLDSTNDYQARVEQEGLVLADACAVFAIPVRVCEDEVLS